ncbi:ABC transporter substrate-binding protein [Arthrobacter sp. M4]|uniref:ABC transporter substrate-binding protein n=1 Tax=Arthrobacter sp. M4 TaxID=218160 RepID=UPI001CDBA127|nr:ABC transporter substrate-binding protein [Arthrobacter sp. M4]MCA4133038.1 ABC transporter substrate-binding protein [Arthrobacter sp. M4]
MGSFLIGVAAPASAVQPAAGPAAAVQVPQATAAPVTINQVLPDGSTLAGTFNITQFVVQNGQLVAQGVFNGTLTSATGVVTQITNAVTSVGVTNVVSNAACSILDLTLGPLHLDLLGLVVDLNQVHLTITAQPGPGNLLGNLLCSLAGLLDQGTGLQGIVNLLNRLLGL